MPQDSVEGERAVDMQGLLSSNIPVKVLRVEPRKFGMDDDGITQEVLMRARIAEEVGCQADFFWCHFFSKLLSV